MKNVFCFICNSDISKTTKVVSFFNYPDKFWDEKVKDWNKRLPQILNGAMCQTCAQKDLELRHNISNGNDKEYRDAKVFIAAYAKSKWFKLGRFLGVVNK